VVGKQKRVTAARCHTHVSLFLSNENRPVPGPRSTRTTATTTISHYGVRAINANKSHPLHPLIKIPAFHPTSRTDLRPPRPKCSLHPAHERHLSENGGMGVGADGAGRNVERKGQRQRREACGRAGETAWGRGGGSECCQLGGGCVAGCSAL
jgi:hypothetical protein